MKIIGVMAKNFLSYRDLIFDFEEGLTAIVGENRDAPGARSNGSGKTATIDAISWALFGETTRGISGDDVIHLGIGKNCVAEVAFDDGTYVRRYRKDKSKKNGLEIIKGDNLISFDRVKDTQIQIEKLVGMDWLTFRQSVLFGQDAVRFLGLTDSDKKAVIERVLGLEILDKASTLAREDQRREAQSEKDLTIESLTLSARAQAAEDELAARKEAIEKRKADREAETARIDGSIAAEKKAEKDEKAEFVDALQGIECEYQDEVSKLKTELATAAQTTKLSESDRKKRQERIDAVVKKIDTVESTIANNNEIGIDQGKTEVEGATKTLDEVNGLLSDQTEKSHSELEEVRKNETERNRLQKEADRILGLSGACPTCLQDVPVKYVKKIAQDLIDKAENFDRVAVEADNRAEVLKESLESLETARDVALKELQEAVQALRDLERDTEDQNKERDRLTGEYERAKQDLADMVKRAAEADEKEKIRLLSDLDAAFSRKGKSLDQMEQAAQKQEHDRTARLQKLQDRRQELATFKDDSEDQEVDRLVSEAKSRRSESSQKETAAAAAQDRAHDLQFWVDGFGLRGLRSLMMDGVLPYLEERANEYLHSLTGGTFRLALSPVAEKKGKKGELRDSVSIAISSSHGADQYAGLSGGERQRVDIAFALALFDLGRTRTGADLGLAVFDEVFERLDDAGCEAVGNLLRSNASRWGSVLIVTHLDGLLSEIPRRVRVVKENGESSIENVLTPEKLVEAMHGGK